jgi:hypothetical protein
MTGLKELIILYSTSSSSPVERISNVSCLELGGVNVPTYDVWLMNIFLDDFPMALVSVIQLVRPSTSFVFS